MNEHDSRLLRYIEKDPIFETPLLRVRVARETAAMLRDLRTKAGLTQRVVADRLGVSQARISQVESGVLDHLPSLDFVHLFARACGRRVSLQIGEADASSIDQSAAAALPSMPAEGRSGTTADFEAQAGGLPGALIELPKPCKTLEVEKLIVTAPDTRTPIAAGIDFKLSAGEILCVIGPTGAGKSALLRTIAGVWSPASGNIRLDGAALNQYSRATFAASVSFMGQESRLRSGTIAENIGRIDANPDPDSVLKAAELAMVHDAIVRLPKGYETAIDQGGAPLSVGLRQRIELARALYEDPFLVVLDSPNAHLDAEGEKALIAALQKVKARLGVAVLSTHKTNVLSVSDYVLVMMEGRVAQYGKTRDVLTQLMGPRPEGVAGKRPRGADLIAFRKRT